MMDDPPVSEFTTFADAEREAARLRETLLREYPGVKPEEFRVEACPEPWSFGGRLQGTYSIHFEPLACDLPAMLAGMTGFVDSSGVRRSVTNFGFKRQRNPA